MFCLTVHVRKDSFVRSNLLFISAYAPADSHTDRQNDEIYNALAAFVRSSSEVVLVADAHVWKTIATQTCLGGDCTYATQRTQCGWASPALCKHSCVDIPNSSRPTATWRSSSTSTLNQINHISVS